MPIPQRTRATLSELSVGIDAHVEYFFDISNSEPFFYIINERKVTEGFGVNLAALFGATGLIAAELEPGEVSTTEIADGALSADAAGRLKMATGFFDALTVLDKFAAGALGPAVLPDVAVNYQETATVVVVDHADGSPKTILAADPNVDRLIFVQAIATQAAAGGPDIDIGADGDLNAVFDDLAAGVWAVGERYFGACVLPATEKLVATIAAAGTAGAFSLRILILTSTVQTNQIAALAVTDAKLAGSISDGKLLSSIVKDPGAYATGVLRMSGVYEDGDEFTVGTDIFLVDAITTDSGDDTEGGFWNNVTDPLTVTMTAALYPVIGVAGTGALLPNELVYIGTEYLRVTAIAGNDVTFRRGACGSTPAAHANAVSIYVSGTRPISHLPVGVQADFAVAVVTPKLVAAILEPAGAVAQSQLVTATSLDAGVELLLVAKALGPLALPTTQVSTNGLWDNATMDHGAVAATRQIFKASIVPSANEVAGEALYIPLPVPPTSVLVRVVVTADGKELETAAALDVQKWDGAVTVVAAAAPIPAYVKITAGTTVKWTAAHTLHILAIQ
jgi:hypothetical protein